MAIELYLDDDADARIRAAWARLDDQGIRSLGTRDDADYHPHVSLSVFDDIDPGVIATACRDVTSVQDAALLLMPALGFFLTDESPAFLAVTPTSLLLDLHRRVVEGIRGHVTGLRPYYEPDGLFFHCTLATAVRDRTEVVRALDGFPLPVVAEGVGLHLVNVLTGESFLNLWHA